MNILVLGANGFVGSAVVRRLMHLGRSRVIGLVRRPPVDGGIDGVQYMHGDITDPSTLARAMREMCTVVCCVSYVGSDDQRCVEVNDRGLRNVAQVASGSRVVRLIYVSTAAVYGTGPFRNLPVDGAPLNPCSAASRTRVAGEQHVREVGGLVVRPHLIYGPGDLWFAPGLIDTVVRLGAVIDERSALLSTIHVDRLARRIVELTETETEIYDRVLHTNEPTPSRVIDILRNINEQASRPALTKSISRGEAAELASQIGIHRRRIDMISLDHWFRNST